MGQLSDSDYNRREGYLELQQPFQSQDLVGGNIIPFLNIYDKEFCAKMVAYRFGRQFVLQPDWAKSDKRFHRTETSSSASVASVCGANERAMNVCKRSEFIC
ncbi:hypothetical protein ACHAXS_001568 [Conticribra weissflogii]